MTRAMTAVAAAGVLALAGCGGGSGNGGSNGGNKGSGGTGSEEAPAAQINEKSRDDLEQGGTLRLSVSELPPNWNPMNLEGNTVDNNDMMGFTMPGNFIYNDDATYDVNPDFLESYDVKDQEGDQPMQVTLKLNKDAKWNNGDPITWEDYEATAKPCNGENSSDDVEATDAYVCASTDGWREISKVEKGADEFEVVVTFKEAYPDWASVLGGPMKKESIADVETFNTAWKTDLPNNDWMAGPFKFDKADKAQKRVTMVPNENWWGDKALLDTVEWSELASDAVPNAFANKEIDVVSYIIDANTYQTVNKRDDAEVRQGTGKQWRHYTFNSKAGVLQDEKVRQGIAMGLDRVQTTKSDLAGIDILNPEELVLGNHFFMPGQEGYEDNSKDTTPYDVEKAGKALDDAGWKMEEGKEYRTNDAGEELGVSYLSISGVSTSENEGKMLQDQMKKLGVKVTMNPTSSNDFFDKVFKGEFEITTFTWQGTPFPMANIDQIYGDGGSNFAQLEIPEVKEMVPQIAVEMDNDKRIEMTNEVDKAIWNAVHTVPIYQRAELTAVPKKLANYGAFGFSTGKPQDIGYEK